MKQNLKRNIVVASVLVFVCAAVFLNWSYNNKWGNADSAMVEAEDSMTEAANAAYDASLLEEEAADEVISTYFANARLTRQQSRDEAMGILQTATTSEAASQETIDSAMSAIATMATLSMQEANIENLLLAKEFTDCVVYLTENGVTVAVPAPVDGLSTASVARITDVITSETNLTASQINIIPVRSGAKGEAETEQPEQQSEEPAKDSSDIVENTTEETSTSSNSEVA